MKSVSPLRYVMMVSRDSGKCSCTYGLVFSLSDLSKCFYSAAHFTFPHIIHILSTHRGHCSKGLPVLADFIHTHSHTTDLYAG